MIVGIVGHEEAKFTPWGRDLARKAIQVLLTQFDGLASGACHLGGVDVWAEEIAREMGKELFIFPPKTHSWATGYKPRNLQIAQAADLVVCLVVDSYPPGYQGMRFDRCYHCNSVDHIKSGGCWTVKQALRMGKPGKVSVIHQ